MSDLGLSEDDFRRLERWHRLSQHGRRGFVRHPVATLAAAARYRSVSKAHASRIDLGRAVSERIYGFTVGRLTYRYHQFWYPGVRLASIGSFTSLGPDLKIAEMNHPIHYVSTNPFLWYRNRGFVESDRQDIIDVARNGKVEIGNDVWIGQRATIMPGVKVADGAVVAGGAVVTNDVEPYAVVGGVPAKVLRYRFDDDVIATLQGMQWWTWDDETIRARLPSFYDPKTFVEEYG